MTRVYTTVTIRMITNDAPADVAEALVRAAVADITELEPGEIDVLAVPGGPITVNEWGYAVPLPPLHRPGPGS